MKKIMGMAKLVSLQSALAECGIESEVFTWAHENGTETISLRADLWNCVDGSNVLFEVYADADSDFEDFESYAEPENDRKAFVERIKQEADEMKE